MAVRLHKAAERAVKQGHPWIFSKGIDKLNKEGQAGDLAMVFGRRDNKLIAIGLYDPASPVRIKVIHHGGPQGIDADFFRGRIREARQLREPLLSSPSPSVPTLPTSPTDAPPGPHKVDLGERATTAYRLLFGENDGFPGLVTDVYGTVAVIKLYSAIWFPWLEMIVPQIVAVAGVHAVVLRLSRHLQQAATPLREGDVLHGELPDPEVEFQEYGVRFRAHVLLGHKTGFFLDHRANRHRIGQLARGKSLLDVFAYAGGFSVHALAGGATGVTSVDISRQALDLAVRNASLNPHAGKHITVAGDAFEVLARLVAEHRRYGIVVIDPPSFAKSEKEMAGALRKYAELALLGARLTEKGGLLVLASCSSRITTDEFLQVHRTAFGRAGVPCTLEDVTGHDIDHPVRFPEGAYLKTAYYRMNG